MIDTKTTKWKVERNLSFVAFLAKYAFLIIQLVLFNIYIEMKTGIRVRWDTFCQDFIVQTEKALTTLSMRGVANLPGLQIPLSRVTRRTFGIGLTGTKMGWFRVATIVII